jgi:hypothetical protein
LRNGFIGLGFGVTGVEVEDWILEFVVRFLEVFA